MAALKASLAVRYGVRIADRELEAVLAALDGALLLENERGRQAREEATERYRAADYRQPILAGHSYPAEQGELAAMLDGYLDEVGGEGTGVRGRGLISPHIDYDRGGPVYAQVWGRSRAWVEEAELAIVLGTDHFGSIGGLTLTRQNYATPFGVLPTARGVVDAVAGVLGEETAYADELVHRGEHSIELAAVWLHHMRRSRPCAMVPILCGTFAEFFRPDGAVEEVKIQGMLELFKGLVEKGGVIVVAAADLSHVGPAFGGPALDLHGRARLAAADEELLACVCRGDAEGFRQSIAVVNDRNSVCGAVPIYLSMGMLAPLTGEKLAYARCPADTAGMSWVTICGVVLK
jgi:AmmeMemoRadiSam system protein B